jgi:hypothetical protein
LATELKTEIGGEFIFENGRLSFVDDSGRSVDKNLKGIEEACQSNEVHFVLCLTKAF